MCMLFPVAYERSGHNWVVMWEKFRDTCNGKAHVLYNTGRKAEEYKRFYGKPIFHYHCYYRGL